MGVRPDLRRSSTTNIGIISDEPSKEGEKGGPAYASYIMSRTIVPQSNRQKEKEGIVITPVPHLVDPRRALA